LTAVAAPVSVPQSRLCGTARVSHSQLRRLSARHLWGDDNEDSAGNRNLNHEMVWKAEQAAARLDLEVSAEWVSPSSRGMCGDDALLLSTRAKDCVQRIARPSPTQGTGWFRDVVGDSQSSRRRGCVQHFPPLKKCRIEALDPGGLPCSRVGVCGPLSDAVARCKPQHMRGRRAPQCRSVPAPFSFSNTCPRWPPQPPHMISTRRMPPDSSTSVTMESLKHLSNACIRHVCIAALSSA
jgi:hypothetical protein